MLQGKKLEIAYHDYIVNYSAEANLAPSTVANKNDVLKRLIAFLDGRPFNLNTCREFIAYMCSHGRKAPNSRMDLVRVLRAFVNFLNNNDYTKDNFAHQIVKPKIPKREFDYIDPEIVEKIILAGTEYGVMDNSRNRAIKDEMRAGLRFILRTGLRINELITLKGSDLNIYDNPPTFWVLSKGGNRELLPLPKDMLEELKKRLNYDRLFSVTRETCNFVLKRGARKLGITTKLTNHSLRHIFASNLVKNGVPIQMVSRLMRHSSVDITDKTYTHLNVNDLALVLNSKQKIIVGGLTVDEVFDNVESAILQTGIKEDKRFALDIKVENNMLQIKVQVQ
ncbi:MAG: tyrosine-type recombinase/integrase [Candidatus Levyibacteriota bacterium]